MDGSQWTALVYCVIAIITFPFAVRFVWKNELEIADRSWRYTPSLGLSGITGLAISIFWPLVLIYWIFMGFLELITIGIKED